MELSTEYMGLSLSSPLVASSSPLTMDLDKIRQLEDAGAAAVVLGSLFEEQIKHEARELEHFLEYGTERFAESLTYFPDIGEFKYGPEAYLDHVATTRQAVDIPVIASLNGVSTGGWIDYARKVQEAGADAIELNIYFLPTNPKVTGRQIEEVYVSILRAVRENVTVPVAVKLSPQFSSIPSIVAQLADAGANGLVLFNRFYQPDIDIENLEAKAHLVLSTSAESRLPLRWIAILSGRIEVSLAATTGIHTGRDVAKMSLAGADATMMCSALLQNGPAHLTSVRQELMQIMDQKGYESVSQMKGVLNQQHCGEPAAFERANYMKTLQSYQPTATRE